MKCNRCGLEIQRIHARSQVNGNWYHLPRRCVELLRQQIHDLQASTIQVADFGGKAAVELTAEITRLREENAELQNERDKYVGATQCATRSAERRWQKLQAIMQIIGTQGDPEVEVSAVMTDLERANNENAALREDKARLDRLEQEMQQCYLPTKTIYVGIERGGYKRLRICSVHAVEVDWHFLATDTKLRVALDKAFAAIDAARKEGRDDEAQGD